VRPSVVRSPEEPHSRLKERQAVADQAKYDILAQHDLEAVDPEAVNPLAEILASLVQAGNQPQDKILAGC
jgi:hypothetical protein